MTDELTRYMWLRQQWHDIREAEGRDRDRPFCRDNGTHPEWDGILDAKLMELMEAWYTLTPDEQSYAAVMTDIRWPHDNDKYEEMLRNFHKYQERT